MDKPKSKIDDYVKKFNDLSAIFDSMPTGVFAILDSNLNIASLNKVAENFIGISYDKIVGQNFVKIFEKKFPGLFNVIEETLKYKRSIKNFTLELENQDGDFEAYLVSTAILNEGIDDDIGIVLVLHDISEVTRLRKAFIESKSFGPLIGYSDIIKAVFNLIETVAQYDTSVLVSGETGTGKELVARAIHRFSPRSQGPFIPVSCSALTTTLLESELFGHEKGAFTGAIKERKGRFELAEGGTLFLDEIDTMTLDVQVKLLRALQERVIERVGSSNTFPVNVRIISATNRNLVQLIANGDFREDLYYRLKVFQINMPPLRERNLDVPLLAAHFINKFNNLYNRGILGLSTRAKEALMNYFWPGNVRELENAIEHAVVLTPGKMVELEYLPPEIRHMKENGTPPPSPNINLRSEEENIRRAIAAFKGNVSKAAENLGMHRSTLWRKMKEFDIEK